MGGEIFYENYWIKLQDKKLLSTVAKEKLMAWLQTDQGFDDSKEKRCIPGEHYGFHIEHTESSSREPTRLLLDLKCLSITIFSIDDSSRLVTTYFDPSESNIKKIIESL